MVSAGGSCVYYRGRCVGLVVGVGWHAVVLGSDRVVDDAPGVGCCGQWASAPVNISRDLERGRRG